LERNRGLLGAPRALDKFTRETFRDFPQEFPRYLLAGDPQKALGSCICTDNTPIRIKKNQTVSKDVEDTSSVSTFTEGMHDEPPNTSHTQLLLSAIAANSLL
jgi:hypothetical protein